MILTLVDDDGKPVSIKKVRLDLKCYPDDEWLISRKAIELYWDFVYREGLWDDYQLKKAQHNASTSQ